MSMFRRRLLMQQAMSVPDPIAKYDPNGHTNEDMAEYPVLTDLTGNGHDITLNNFAWSGMSGIGGYTFNFSVLTTTLPECITEKNDHSIRINKTVYGRALLVSNDISNIPTLKSKIKISGLPTDEGYVIFRYYNQKNLSGDNSTVNLTNGTHDVDLSPSSETQDSFYIYIPVQQDQGITEDADLDIRIELVPLYGNALVSDGVDDYGICENFPILTKEKGYTVVAVRKWLTADLTTESLLNKCFLSDRTSSGEPLSGVFNVELNLINGCYSQSFGDRSKVNISNEDFIYQNSTSYCGQPIQTSSVENGNGIINVFSLFNSDYASPISLYALEIYDRDLIPYQIEVVKKRMMDEYNNPEDTTSDWYGVEWYTNQSPSRVMRIGNMNLHRTLPIQSGMYRCILNDNGEEAYKLDPNDSTKKEDGTPAVLDGTDGNVMVYIPVFYARFESKGYRRRVKLSDHYKPGFIKMGGCYISAYEATLDRTMSTLVKLASVANTTANFRGGSNNAEWDSTYRSLLGMPATSISLTNFRNYARNRKDGDTQWNCMDYTAYKAVYWLYVVEYADRNSQLDFNENLTSDGFRQGGLGAGVTNINGTKWNSFNSYYPFVPCGHTNSLGNKTGIVQFIMPFEYDAGGAANYAGAYDTGTPYTDGQFVSDGQELYECIADAASGTALSDTTYFTHTPRTSTQVPSYRGIENIFGHIWKWTDGVHIKVQSEEAGGKSILYTSDNPANYQDTNYDGYEEKGYIARASGYIRDIIFGRDGDFYVSEDGATGGSSTTYFSDYSYTNIPESGESLRGILLGGYAVDGSRAGLVFVNSLNGPSITSANVGSRLCYIPNN